MWIVLPLLAGLFAANARPVAAQLRESIVEWQQPATCLVETLLPGGTQLSWNATLEAGSDSVLEIEVFGGSDLRSTLAVAIDAHGVGIGTCQVYGAGGQEIAVVRSKTIRDDYPKDETLSVVSFVRLLPDLGHLHTSVIRSRTGLGASRWPIDFWSMWRGDGYGDSKLEISYSNQSLRATTVETRRRVETHDELVIGASSRLFGQGGEPVSPPSWLSRTQAAVVQDDNPAYGPIAPVEAPPGIVAVLSAEPETIFPPRTLIIDMQIGQRRAHGLLDRDLGAARSDDRRLAARRSKNVQNRLKEQPDVNTEDGTSHVGFRWSEAARSMFGVPRLDVVIMNDAMIVGTIERECVDPPLGEATPRDLWMFKVDLKDGEPAWIESQLVASCALIPVRGLANVGFVYRTFDNGRLKPHVVDGETIGLRAILEPARPVLSKGEPRIAEWAELQSHSKWVELAYLLEDFEPQHAKIDY